MTGNKGKNKMDGADADISHMSPKDRAELSALIEKDGDADLRQHLLGAMGRSETARGSLRAPREVPSTWSIVHALDRLEEAFQVMAMMPGATRPKAYGSAWPSVVQEKIPLVILAEMSASGELETQQEEQNRVRLPPSSAQITRMEQALRWPFEYLRDRPELARAISQRAMWAAMRVDIRRRCERRGIDHDEFNEAWQEGLNIITVMLIALKVPVS
jgi:Domain of unknown function (DUF6362)